MSLICCQNTAFSYDGIQVIGGLNFSVEQGDYLCIVGENGAGKSTLIKGLLRLKKPSGGTFVLGDGLIPNEIGYLPQQTVVQKDFPASVYEVVSSGCLNQMGWRPFLSKEERTTVKKNMERLGISHLSRRCYRELSGGQQQRVLLARALCATRKILLLDEPTAGLDPVVTAELYELIGKLNREDGITIIMVSHDVQASVQYAKYILHLCHTQLFFGTVEDYQVDEIGRRFLGGGQHV